MHMHLFMHQPFVFKAKPNRRQFIQMPSGNCFFFLFVLIQQPIEPLANERVFYNQQFT